MAANDTGAPDAVPSEAHPVVAPKPQPEPVPATKSRLWLWFVAAFLIQGAAWTTWFVIAAQHQVAEVPLATRFGQPVKGPKEAKAHK